MSHELREHRDAQILKSRITEKHEFNSSTQEFLEIEHRLVYLYFTIWMIIGLHSKYFA